MAHYNIVDAALCTALQYGKDLEGLNDKLLTQLVEMDQENRRLRRQLDTVHRQTTSGRSLRAQGLQPFRPKDEFQDRNTEDSAADGNANCGPEIGA